MHPRQWSDLHGWIFMYWEWEKTFADCSLLSCQEMPRHQTSWRKLSQIATKPQNSQKFSPSNFSCHMACTIKLCLPLMSHMIKGTGLSPSIAQGRAWEWGYTKTTCRHRVLNHTPGRLTGENFNSSSIYYIQDLPECFLLTRYLQMRVGHDLQNKTH